MANKKRECPVSPIIPFTTKQLNWFGGIILFFIFSYLFGLLNPVIYMFQANEKFIGYGSYVLIGAYFATQWLLFIVNSLRHPAELYITVTADGKKQAGFSEERQNDFQRLYRGLRESQSAADKKRMDHIRQVIWDERFGQYTMTFNGRYWPIGKNKYIKDLSNMDDKIRTWLN